MDKMGDSILDVMKKRRSIRKYKKENVSKNLLLQLIPLHQKEILQIISSLKKIKTVGERQFPNARSFIRPGLDE